MTTAKPSVPGVDAVREALEECASRCRYDGDLFHDQHNELRRDASWKAADMATTALAALAPPSVPGVDQIEGIIADCVSIEPFRWKDEDGRPATLSKIVGIHEAANQIRAALASPPSVPGVEREKIARVAQEKMADLYCDTHSDILNAGSVSYAIADAILALIGQPGEKS
jgi:hypothetical protein